MKLVSNEIEQISNEINSLNNNFNNEKKNIENYQGNDLIRIKQNKDYIDAYKIDLKNSLKPLIQKKSVLEIEYKNLLQSSNEILNECKMNIKL